MVDYVRVRCPECGEHVDVAVRVQSVSPERHAMQGFGDQVERAGIVTGLHVDAAGVAAHTCAGQTTKVDGL